MKKIILSLAIVLISIFIVSCQSEYKKNFNKMSKLCQELIIQDFAQDSIEIIEYTPIEYITKSNIFIDSLIYIENLDILDLNGSYVHDGTLIPKVDLTNILLDNVKRNLSIVTCDYIIDGGRKYKLVCNKENDIKKMLNKAQECIEYAKLDRDSIDYYIKDDSTLSKNLKFNLKLIFMNDIKEMLNKAQECIEYAKLDRDSINYYIKDDSIFSLTYIKLELNEIESTLSLAKEWIEDAKLNIDSLNNSLKYYMERDSILSENLNSKIYNDSIYILKVYVKGIDQSEFGKNEIGAGTLYYIFDSNCNEIKINYVNQHHFLFQQYYINALINHEIFKTSMTEYQL